MKEEQLMKKVKDILTEEEKLRIPIAQGLPWTIDEPEVISFSRVNRYFVVYMLRINLLSVYILILSLNYSILNVYA